jgi:hypothetical protein
MTMKNTIRLDRIKTRSPLLSGGLDPERTETLRFRREFW